MVGCALASGNSQRFRLSSAAHDPQLPAPHADARRRMAAALDVGRARIGLACTDARVDVALAAEVLTRKGTRQDLAVLLPWLAQRQVRICVVGLPPAQADAEAVAEAGSSSRLCRQFAQALAAAWPAGEVWLVDEADTTAEAHATLRLLGRSAAQRRKEVDRFAAKQILDRWLAGAPAERIWPEAAKGGA